MVICSVLKSEEKVDSIYDLSSVVTTLKVAKIKNLKQASNLACQMEKVLKELSIISDSRIADLDKMSDIY